MKLTVKEVVLFSLLGSILFISQVALNFIPNVELVSLLVIIYSLVYGKKSILSVGIFVLAEGVFYGFGTWWLGYLIIWPSLALLTIMLKKWIEGKFLCISIFSAIFGLIFGALYALPYILVADWTFAFAYWLRGLPFDLIHMVGNYFAMLLLGETVYKLLVRLNKSYFNIGRI